MDAPGPVAARVKPGARVPVFLPATGRYYCGVKGLPRTPFRRFLFFLSTFVAYYELFFEQTCEKKKTGLASTVAYSVPPGQKSQKFCISTRRTPCRTREITLTNIFYERLLSENCLRLKPYRSKRLVCRFTVGSEYFRKSRVSKNVCDQVPPAERRCHAVRVRRPEHVHSCYTHRGNKNTGSCKTNSFTQSPKSTLVTHTVTSLRCS